MFMPISQIRSVVLVCAPMLVGITINSVWAQDTNNQSDIPQVLDAQQHLQTPEYQSVFSEKIIPLDTTLSWTERFEGNETFNSKVRLDPSQAAMPAAMTVVESSNQSLTESMWDASGVVKSIRLETNKIKIEHEVIERLAMPAMTMLFSLNDVGQLSKLKKGQTVNFNVENTASGFVITKIAEAQSEDQTTAQSATPSESTDSMDGIGIVKTIRGEKIKLEHGPIDRLGMPAMTMMFKVIDPSLLEGLEKGSNIKFNVDNTPSGFVITDIKPAK